MSSKVKCTCGWSWNKSDSSKKDMYICHECGRDNSNNMRNGGWLDNYGEQENYNDYKVSAPEGMVGDGFSNVGRNYSPAWGGQFQEGGEIPNAQKGKKVKPLYVESKNDPRYRAYQDSLSLYNKGIKEEKEYNNFIKKNNIPKKVTRQWSNPVDDDNNINTKIEPIQGKGFIYNHKPDVISGTNIPAKLSNNRVMIYKKPQQQVIVRPKEVKPKEKLVPLQPMSLGLQDVNNRFETNLDIPTPVQRKPKYYNITDVNNQYGGGDTSYRVDSLDELRELPKEQWDRKITPQYQMGGNVYPVNYVPQAQEGTQVLNSRQKRGLDLLIKETKKAKEDKKELQTTGQIKYPKSIKYKKQKKELDKKQTFITQDNRSEAVRKIDEEKGQAIENKKQFKKNIIAPLDVATDIMQLGNFVPHPYGQIVGEIGNFAGAGIDAYQAIDDFSEENYGSAAINAGSVFLPMALGSQTFRRNSKYLQPGQPLYPLSPQANLPANATISQRLNIPNEKYIEPFTKVQGMTDTSLLANRALLGTLGAETLYDIPKFQSGGSMPGSVGFTYARTQGIPSKGPRRNQVDVTDASAQNGQEMQYYREGLDWKPKTISRKGSIIKDDMGQWANNKKNSLSLQSNWLSKFE